MGLRFFNLATLTLKFDGSSVVRVNDSDKALAQDF